MRRVGLRGHHAQHFAIVDADALAAVEVPLERYAERRQHFRPAGAMHRLAVHQHTVEVEEDGVKWGHGANIA